MQHDPAAYGDVFADVYDDLYADLEDVTPLIDAVTARLAARGGGSVIEIGVGTGRIAIPLAARGIEVIGIDSSPAMLDRLAAKQPVGVSSVLLDLSRAADLDAHGLRERATIVVLATNTLYCFLDDEQQTACLANARQMLRPGGQLLVEAVLANPVVEPGASFEETSERHGRSLTITSTIGGDGQSADGEHRWEGDVRARPWRIYLTSIEQLDGFAGRAGLELVERAADWAGRQFDDTSTAHKSWYEAARL